MLFCTEWVHCTLNPRGIKIVLFIFQSHAVLLVTDGLSTGSTWAAFEWRHLRSSTCTMGVSRGVSYCKYLSLICGMGWVSRDHKNLVLGHAKLESRMCLAYISSLAIRRESLATRKVLSMGNSSNNSVVSLNFVFVWYFVEFLFSCRVVCSLREPGEVPQAL